MEEESSLIFQEGNYLQSSFAAFQELRMKRELTDVVIKVRDREFPAHRVVLAARIPHFQSILSTQEKVVVLNEIDPDVLESIIDFAYEGKLKITATNAQSMFFAAVRLNLKQVQQVCLSFLGKRYNSNIDTATSSFVKVIPSEDTIRDKFDEFSQSEEFLFLPYYSIKQLLSRDDLKVRNEEKVFEALIKWTKMSLVERQHCLPYLLVQIRLNYLSPEYLIDKVAAEGLIKMSEQCRHIVEEAKSYHLLKKRMMFMSFKTHPRLYTEIYRDVICDTATTVNTNQCGSSSEILAANQIAAQSECVVITTNQNVACSTASLTTSQSSLQGNVSNAVMNVSVGSLTTSQSSLQSNAVMNVDPASLTTSQSSLQGNVSNAVMNVGVASLTTSQSSLQGNAVMNVGALCNARKNVSNGIRYGLYAVCSFASAGTYVSYYDVSKRKWNHFPKNSQSDYVLNVVPVKEKLYVFFPSTFETFSLVTHEWAVLEPLASPIEGSGMAPHGGIIYVFGGCHFPNKIRCFDTLQSKWLEDETMLYPRRNMGVVSSPKHIFLTGGYGTSCCNTFSKFQPILKQWTELPSMAFQRMDHDSAIVNDKVYVYGGSNNTVEFLHIVEVYDNKSTQWSFVSVPKVCRRSLSLVSYDTKIYVFGGATEKETCACGVDMYDTQTDKWLPMFYMSRVVPRIAQGPINSSLPTTHLPPEEKLLPVIIRGVAVQEE